MSTSQVQRYLTNAHSYRHSLLLCYIENVSTSIEFISLVDLVGKASRLKLKFMEIGQRKKLMIIGYGLFSGQQRLQIGFNKCHLLLLWALCNISLASSNIL